MARPSLGKERVIVSLLPELLRRLTDYAKSLGRTRADLVQEAVAEYLDRHAPPERQQKRPK